jgi:NAD(P)-dependent dehydrogenase (short-subunit alcohol dehydrogenase family)
MREDSMAQSEPGKGARHIVIAGASSGIGAALTSALAAAGDHLYVCARREDRLREITRVGPSVVGFACDVANEGQVQEFWDSVAERTPVVDALINSAGGFGVIGPVEQTDSQGWLETLQVNLFGTYLMIKHGLPLLRQSVDARILNLSGGGAFDAFPNYSAYACSKAGVVRLTECLAAELADDHIAVNALAPGLVATETHEATLAQGPELAGDQFQLTLAMLEGGGARMETVIRCVRRLLAPELRGLTGKTVGVNYDPWESDRLPAAIPEIVASDLWTMRRINPINLISSSLRSAIQRMADER